MEHFFYNILSLYDFRLLLIFGFWFSGNEHERSVFAVSSSDDSGERFAVSSSDDPEDSAIKIKSTYIERVHYNRISVAIHKY